MDLLDRYLAAVAAQLPRAERDDITAELRDLILSRFEAREEELGRPLTPDEQQAILREIGHPLVVAARYGRGPDVLIGPALYPWWLFGVKVGLLLLAVIAIVSALIQIGPGDAGFARAFSRSWHDFFAGGLTLVGVATIAGFILERQTWRPGFVDNWRVEDLGVFEIARLDSEPVAKAVRARQGKSEQSAPRACHRRAAPCRARRRRWSFSSGGRRRWISVE